MDMSKLLELLKRAEGKTYDSPRERALEYRIKKVDEYKKKIVMSFSSGHPVDLKFQAFNAVIDYLIENADRFVRVGATTQVSSDADTIEYIIQSLEPNKTSYTKRAPHICDL